MAPPTTFFHASNLPTKVQFDAEGKGRKPPTPPAPGWTGTAGPLASRGTAPDLKRDCELRSLTQYECSWDSPSDPNSKIVCSPIKRLFRRCMDKNGPFLVETTTWEGPPGAMPATVSPGDWAAEEARKEAERFRARRASSK